ncbi:hypothetical protein B0H11DRAFT_2273314 [Mycena galericulata]|nr:hypothetical protein B0H11DRAFT_2273314 [Mycena galericulata]
MHHALRKSSLNKLPASFRRIAIAVLASNLSEESIQHFASFLDTLSEDSLADFLPVHYTLLDPARIPTANQLDSCPEDVIRTVALALLSLEAVFAAKTTTPPEAGPDLWPRVWRWVEFMLTYREYLGSWIHFPSEDEFCRGFIRFSQHMCSHIPNEPLIVSTPGFPAVAARVWASILQDDRLTGDDGPRLSIPLWFLTHTGPFVDDMIEGAGGSMDDLARLMVLQLEFLVTVPDIMLIQLLEFVLNIVALTDRIGQKDEPDPNPKRLCLAMVSHGFIKILTIITHQLSEISDPDPGRVIDKCLHLLTVVFQTERGNAALRVALKNGLIGTIVTCAQRPFSNAINHTLHFLLVHILPPATVYYRVLVDIAPGYFGAAGNIPPDMFHRADVFEAWTKFMQLVSARLGILRVFDVNQHISRRACDNVDCGRILKETDLKCCAGCREALYCSRECQRIDWDSGHRESCMLYLSRHEVIRPLYTSRECAFFRALLSLEYESSRARIYLEFVKAWAAKPDAEFFALYDYKNFRLQVTLHEITADSDDDESSRYWAYMIARAARSAGRMTLNIMRMREGTGQLDLVIPLRRTTADVPHALKKIATGMTSVDLAEVKAQIDNLLRPDFMDDIH